MTYATTASTGSSASTTTITGRSTAKLGKLSDHRHHNHHQPLLPGLPDDIAHLCLSLVPPSILYSVCRSWRRLIYSPSFPPFLSIYALLFSPQTEDQIPHFSNSLEFAFFEPISSTWQSLPPPPPDPPLRLLLRHPSFISRNLPIQSVACSGNLVLLAATTDQFLPALPRPLIFNPLTRKWTLGPPLATPRRWCAAGASCETVYVASGIGSHYNPVVARSVESLNINTSHSNIKDSHHNNQRNRSLEVGWTWENMGALRDGKFSREAIEAVGWRRKLCMVNVKGDAAKEGVVYDVESDAWGDMPEGMLAGWRGPAAAMDEDIIYMVDESRGALRMYEPERDAWVEILQTEELRGADNIAAGGGRVCVVCCGGIGIVVVDVVSSPPRLWVVDTPPGFQTMAIHVLPRMSQPDFQTPVLASTSMD
ncbi:unnamed protein product [Ilex paraguariensis]|uniref:F-box/kelch-repeat protein SKIP25 n=1 Tax=Ilex paraguariensis TaxID=185542 RepID=A0ABC8SU08_9AQUA